MKKIAATVLALAVAVPAFAGGSHCSGASATSADAKMSCAGKTSAAAWTGAWLERSASGQVTVAEVAKGSPAQKSGLKTGDVVLAVNGYRLADNGEHGMCASKAECNVGSKLSYTIQRGGSTKSIKLKLEKMPADATARFSRQAKFDASLAAMVVTPNAN